MPKIDTKIHGLEKDAKVNKVYYGKGNLYYIMDNYMRRYLVDYVNGKLMPVNFMEVC